MSNIDLSRVITAKDRAAQDAAAAARSYLHETDWYVTRQAETGTPVPADVAEKRRRARKTADARRST